jgi:hypothetical protein
MLSFNDLIIIGRPGILNEELHNEIKNIFNIFKWDKVNQETLDLFQKTINEMLELRKSTGKENTLVWSGVKEVISNIELVLENNEETLYITYIVENGDEMTEANECKGCPCKGNVETQNAIEDLELDHGKKFPNVKELMNDLHEENVPLKYINFSLERLKEFSSWCSEQGANFIDYLDYGHGLVWPDERSSWSYVAKFCWENILLGLCKLLFGSLVFVILPVLSLISIVTLFVLFPMVMCTIVFLLVCLVVGLPD